MTTKDSIKDSIYEGPRIWHNRSQKMAGQSQTEFRQQLNGTTLTFSVREDKLCYSHSDASGEHGRDILWHQIDLESAPTTLRAKGYSLKYPDWTLLIMGALTLLSSLDPSRVGVVIVGFVILSRGVHMHILRRRGVSYSLFKTADHPVRVMRDKQYDQILAELRKHRAASLKKLLGAVNKANDPAKEMAKFQWLRKAGAITDEELEQALAEIRAQHASPAPVSAVTIQ